MFEKSRLFAYLNLEDSELLVYEKLYTLLSEGVPRPDLVVYLQAPTEVLVAPHPPARPPEESHLSEEYLAEVNRAYNHYFFHYTQTPLLVVNTAEVDFVKHEADLDDLVKQIRQMGKGTQYYVPRGTDLTSSCARARARARLDLSPVVVHAVSGSLMAIRVARQLALPFEEPPLWDATALEAALARASRTPGPPHAHREPLGAALLPPPARAHRSCACTACSCTRRPRWCAAVARSLRRRGRRADGEVRRFMNENLHRVRKVQRALPPLVTAGRAHDLQAGLRPPERALLRQRAPGAADLGHAAAGARGAAA